MEANYELPLWFPLRKVAEKATIEEMINIGKARLLRLLNFRPDSAGESIRLNLLNGREELIGNLTLRIVAAVSEDRIFTSWLIEREGDFFSWAIKHASIIEKKAIINELFKTIQIGWSAALNELGMDKDSIWRELYYIFDRIARESKGEVDPQKISKNLFREDGVCIVRFWEVPRLIKRRRGILRNGWFITFMDTIISEAKWAYERVLYHKIQELIARKRQKNLNPAFQEISEQIINIWKEKRAQFISSVPAIKDAGAKPWEREDLFPLCMRILRNRLRTTGYLSHGERLQIGLFLKRLGMPLEDQMKMWYTYAVDNLGMSWDEFEKKAGYIIKHIYGLVGSKKDYEVPKCDTIITKYFCPYHTLQIDELREVLSNLNITTENFNDKISQILRLSEQRKPKLACWYYLQLITQVRLKEKEISHPIQFFRLAIKFSKKKR
ncbi:MAG: hypothetical protein ACTSVW_03160 [Candidatus Njordarchaeales archaeon]